MQKIEDLEAEIVKLKDKMNRIFLDYHDKQTGTLNEIEWEPDLDILEDKDNIIIKLDIPGMTADGIDLTILGDVIQIKGERKREIGREDENYHYIGCNYGKFDIKIPLPTPIDNEKIKASYKNGVLTVILPKLEKKESGEQKIKME
jgi:HSP20 family protein